MKKSHEVDIIIINITNYSNDISLKLIVRKVNSLKYIH